MRAAVYARISEDRDETQLGVGRQVEDCEQLAQQRGWTIAERYVDNSISAYKRVQRPEWERMLADIQARRVDAVIVYHLDRLLRQPRDLERFFDVCDGAGLTSMATVTGKIDLATAEGKFQARIEAAVASKSSDDMSRRIRRKHLQLAQEGRPAGGGSRPFGYEADFITLRADEAAIIRELAERLLAGESIRSLAILLEERGVKTTTGRRWTTQVLRRLLASARISGQRQHRGEIVGPAIWPAIITPEQTRQIRALLADPRRRATRPPQSYVLKGLLRCGHCNATLVSRPREDGVRRYVCATGPNFTGCGKTYVLGPPIEAWVTEAVFARLDNPDLQASIEGRARSSGDPHQERADQITARLDELAGAYAAEQITMREWLAARGPLQDELADVQRRISRDTHEQVIREHLGNAAALRERWGRMPIERRHAILSAMLHHVIVGSGTRGLNRFEPSRFTLVWRH